MIVLFGPRTRLGAQLCARLAATDGGSSRMEPGEPVFLVARDANEAEELAGSAPAQHDVWSLADPQPPVAPGSDDSAPLTIVLAALGLLHPERPRRAEHLAALQRDLDGVARILQAHRARPVHALLVSSVLALAPGRDRAWYGGLKNAGEAALAEVLQEHGNARLTVLYPGRLVERRTGSPGTWLGTPFDSLGARILRLARAGAAGSRGRGVLVGIDARLWMMLRSVRFAGLGVRPSFPTPRLEDRERPSPPR